MLAAEVIGAHDKSHGALGQGLNKIGQAVQNPDNGVFVVKGFSHFYSDCGLFGLYFVGSPEDLQNATLFISHIIRDQGLNMMDSTALRAKRSLQRKLIQDMYNPQALQDKLAQDIFFGAGRPESLEEVVAKVEAVDTKKLQDMFYEYTNDQDFARSAYGATEAVFDYMQNKDALHGFRW